MTALRRVGTIARHEVRVLRRDSASVLAVTILPVVALAIFVPALEPLAEETRGRAATGAEIAAPGVVAIFSVVLVGVSAWNVYQERVWRTWDRLRLTPARPAEVLAGVLLPCLGLLAVQLCLVYGAATTIFDLRVEGSLGGLAVVAATFSLAVAAMGIALVAWARTVQEVNTFTHIGAITLAGLSGALTPVDRLPGWVGAIAPALPTYWAIEGLSEVIDGASLADVGDRAAVLVAFALLFAAIGIAGFRRGRWHG